MLRIEFSRATSVYWLVYHKSLEPRRGGTEFGNPTQRRGVFGECLVYVVGVVFYDQEREKRGNFWVAGVWLGLFVLGPPKGKTRLTRLLLETVFIAM